MNNSIDKALADSQRSYLAAKAAVADVANSIMASTRGSLPIVRSNSMSAAEQLRHFRGWVYAAIRPIAQTIAGQVIKVGARHRESRRAKVWDNVRLLPEHPLAHLLADPNELMVSWSLMYVTVASLELTGKSFWWVTEVDHRKQILPVPTSWISGFEGSTSYQTWLVRPPGSAEDFPIPSAEMVFCNYPDPGDPHGAVSPLMASAAAVDADEAIQLAQSQVFKRGIHPSVALIVGKHAGPDGSINTGARPQLSAAQRRQLIRSIHGLWTGVIKAGEPLILDGLIEDVKKLSSTPAEMDFLGSGEWTKKRILQAFGTNPVIMGEELSNRASSLAAEIHFAKFTVNPKIELISQCLTAWLGPMFGDGDRLVVQIEPYAPKDEELEIRKMQLLGQFGAVSADELRNWANLGLSPFPGGLGKLPIPAPASVQDALERMVNAQVMVTGRMIAQDVVDRQPERKARTSENGHSHNKT